MNPKLVDVVYIGQKRVFIFSHGNIFLIKAEGEDIDTRPFIDIPSKEQIMEHFQEKE